MTHIVGVVIHFLIYICIYYRICLIIHHAQKNAKKQEKKRKKDCLLKRNQIENARNREIEKKYFEIHTFAKRVNEISPPKLSLSQRGTVGQFYTIR